MAMVVRGAAAKDGNMYMPFAIFPYLLSHSRGTPLSHPLHNTRIKDASLLLGAPPLRHRVAGEVVDQDAVVAPIGDEAPPVAADRA